MNTLLAAFIAETRETLGEIDDCLALPDSAPLAPETVNRLFRAVHTIKGNCGLFDLPPMLRAAHLAESMLSETRNGTLVLGKPERADLRRAVDLITGWLDTLAEHGALPADAPTAADALAALLSPYLSEDEPTRHIDQPEAATADWLAAFPPDALAAALAQALKASAERIVVARYTPDSGCFFSGEDPLYLARSLPGLIGLALLPGDPADDLAFDPFSCRLDLALLSLASKADVGASLSEGGGRIELADIAAAQLLRLPPDFPVAERTALSRLLEHQLTMLGPAGVRTALPSALTVIAKCLRRLGGAPSLLPLLDPANPDAPVIGPRLGGMLLEALASQPVPNPDAAPTDTLEAGSRPIHALRISEQDIDHAVALINEAMVAKNALAGLLGTAVDPLWHAQLQELGKRIDDLFATLRTMRMVSLHPTFQRLGRLVRNLEAALGRAVHLHLEGDDTVADKTIVDAVYDALVHLIRNAVDHGAETAAERLARGKPAAIGITVRAYLRDEQTFTLEVRDDGRGIDLDRVKRRALERGLLDAADQRRLKREEALQLIFHPGFSTAETVSDISGRGVGLDVVDSTVRRLGGDIQVDTREGEGTAFLLHLPLSLTLSRLMDVRWDAQWFAVPVGAIEETLRVPLDHVKKIKHAETLSWRGEILPLVRLGDRLGLPLPRTAPLLSLLLLNLPGGRCLLEIDEFGDTLEAMVRPLDGVLASVRAYAGSALSARGEVRLVLNVKELIAA